MTEEFEAVGPVVEIDGRLYRMQITATAEVIKADGTKDEE